MFNPIEVIRLLNTKNVELYLITSQKYEFDYYTLIVDLRRKSKLSDFPELIGIEEECDVQRNNTILVAFITEKHFKEYEKYEPILKIVSDLIEHKESCSQVYKIFEEEIPLDLTFGDRMVEFTNGYLAKLGLDTLQKIDSDKFNLLSQD